jgi:fumarate hydratase subunit beta
MKYKNIHTPFDNKTIEGLKPGDMVLISGEVYTARDVAHQKLTKLIAENKPLPFNLEGNVIYYVGPSPAKPGSIIGSAGPTTSYRMDPYTPILLKHGLKGMIGKGKRSKEVIKSIKKNKAVYFAAVGGAGAFLSKKIVRCELVAYPEIEPESIYKLEVKDFPAVVINDMCGNDLYDKKR